MEHPFLHNLDEKSLEELQTGISDLTKKLNFAYRMNNGPMINQINMAITSFRTAYDKKMNDLINKQKVNMQIKVDKK
jgi:hypothetical protein